MITLCKVVQMRETVSTAPRSTLLLHLDKVMLETACERWGVCRRALACASERGACLYLARALLLVCVGVSVHACMPMRARGVRVFGARSLFPTRERESGSVLAGSSVCLLARV